jgi:hypothetical protein
VFRQADVGLLVNCDGSLSSKNPAVRLRGVSYRVTWVGPASRGWEKPAEPLAVVSVGGDARKGGVVELSDQVRLLNLSCFRRLSLPR